MVKPTEITIKHNGVPQDALDFDCIFTALATVPGHRFQDNKLATNVILREVYTELYTKKSFERLVYRIGNYTFVFVKPPEPDKEPDTSSTSVL